MFKSSSCHSECISIYSILTTITKEMESREPLIKSRSWHSRVKQQKNIYHDRKSFIISACHPLHLVVEAVAIRSVEISPILVPHTYAFYIYRQIFWQVFLKVGTHNDLLILTLVQYCGARIICLSILLWNFSRMSILDFQRKSRQERRKWLLEV